MTSSDEVLLCCFLWANTDLQSELKSYETEVLSFMPDFGGEVLQRVISDGANGHPHEVQILRFPSKSALDSFVADPRRAALGATRDRVVAKTELFPISFA